MAGQSRTLKLSILADIDNLKKNLNSGSNEVEGFGTKLGGFAKKAGAAFAEPVSAFNCLQVNWWVVAVCMKSFVAVFTII